jgi:hypothetical protein
MPIARFVLVLLFAGSFFAIAARLVLVDVENYLIGITVWALALIRIPSAMNAVCSGPT